MHEVCQLVRIIHPGHLIGIAFETCAATMLTDVVTTFTVVSQKPR
jgi:hypothetical protein